MNSFGDMMKSWRAKFGVSQLELSLRCDVSQKHISFLETGRNKPSKPMVLTICENLNIPLRDRNVLLSSAGFAPHYKETDLEAPEMAVVSQALDMMLQAQDPLPGVVFDSHYNLLRANQGAIKLQCFLYGVSSPHDLPQDSGNLLRGLFDPNGYRKYIVNWEEVVVCLLRRLQGDVHAMGGAPELQQLLDELASYRGVPRNWRQVDAGDWHGPMLTIDFDKDGVQLSFFSTIASLGTPQDISLQEIRIESFFPGNEETRNFFLQA